MILIVGGNGFVGQHVARYLLDTGHEVTVATRGQASLPRLLAGDIEAGRAKAVRLDVTDGFAVAEAVQNVRPSVIIDLAGYHPGALSPGRDVAFRTSSLTNILEASRLFEVSRVVLMSSMDVYWGLPSEEVPFREDDRVPLLESGDHYIVQSWAKKALEVIGNHYRQAYGMNIAFVRASGIYGPLYRTYLNVPSRLVRAAVNGADALEGPYPAPFADEGYDQLYVKDMARAIGLVACATELGHPVYNIGSGRAPRFGEFADAVRAAVPGFAVDLPLRPAASERGTMDGRWMNIDRARSDLGFEPQWEPAAAMADYIGWVSAHGL